MIPDDTAGRPLTPGEQQAIADLERRFLLETPVPARERRANGLRSGTRGYGPSSAIPQAAGPLLVLLGTTLLLVAAVIAAGGGLLGAVAVLASGLATALVWPLLPVAAGGPPRPARRRPRRPVRRR